MRLVLGISTVLGVIGVVSAFGLFFLAERVFHLDRGHAQTMMYLKLSVAGHLTIFLTRTRGPFWSIRPAKILWIAVIGTQIIATLIAVYGMYIMTPLGWGWAAFVWGYALVWFLVNDRIKLLAYRIFDPVKTEPRSETKSEPKPGAKAETKPERDTKVAPELDVKGRPKPTVEAALKPAVPAATKPEPKSQPMAEAKTPPDVSPKVVERVHELYEELGREEVLAVQEWEKGATEVKATTGSGSATKTLPDLKPQIAERANELYEQGGRQDGHAVQDWAQAEREVRKAEAKKQG